MMKASVARELASALRHGGYVQTHGVLRNGNTFCAMGVAADLFGPLFNQQWVSASGCDIYHINMMAIGGPDNNRWPSDEICLHMIESRAVEDMYSVYGKLQAGNAGMIFAPPNYCMAHQETTSVSFLNDEGVSFRVIADLLDAHAAKMDELYPTVPDTLPAEYTRELVH